MPVHPLIHPLLALVVATVLTASSFPIPLMAGTDRTSAKLTKIDQAVQRAIDKGQIPGAVVLVGQASRIVFEKAYGHRSLAPKVEPMTLGTRFDLASLTKVVATTPGVMLLVQAGKLKLGDPVVEHLPDFGQRGKDSITIQQLLTHYSGLAPFFRLPERGPGRKIRDVLARVLPFLFHSAKRGPGATERIVDRIYQSGTSARPGTQFIYSDLGFILLGKLIEVVSGERLDQWVQSRVFSPLKMSGTQFGSRRSDYQKTAPTEKRADGTFLRGQVHDPLSSMMGGVAGHAGLFSTARDLARFCQMFLNEGSLQGTMVFNPRTVRQTVTPQSPPGMPNIRGLGWDIQSVYSSVKGEHFSSLSYGHTGFTGTSLWIDPEIRTYLIVLTSRLHPDGKGDVRPLRKEIANIVGDALSPGPGNASGG